MANKYKVKAGVHIEGGRSYKKGETVVSPLPLTTMFPEKFEDLGEVAPAAPKGRSSSGKPKTEGGKPEGDDWDGDKT